ncbi:MAG: TonB-dependent receptor, partial [Parabacteroides gordonii]|nr:TonB-dependent receptor [Parabacteroides gordonii]
NALDELFKDNNISYKISANTVFLKEKPQSNVVTSQPVQVKGSILDNKGEPIIGASILEKGTTNGTITDIDGNFFLNVSSNQSTLVISYVGYKTQEIIASKANIQIILHEDSEALEEVVVIGYGTQSRAKITSAISKIDGSKLVGGLAVSSFDQALASKMPGVNIQQANGAPGAGVNIKIRGTNSINYGGHPLVVVDGVPLSNNSFNNTMQGGDQYQYNIDPLSSINPADIESIDVLKDAASAAIYGSRGSNGVIMITTKKGKEGKAKVNFSMYAGFSDITKKVDVMDAYELANFTKKACDLAWVQAGGNIDDPQDIRTGANYKYPDYMQPYIDGKQGLTNTDWQDEVYRTAIQQNYDINVSGGTEKMNYYVSGNYTNQEGIIINSGMKRYSIRTNVNANITDKLKLGLRMNASQTDNSLVKSESSWSREGVVITALMYHPNLPAYNEDGSIASNLMINEAKKGVNVAAIQNPVALAELVKNHLVNRTFNGNANLEYTIIDGLKAQTSFGVESIGMHRFYYRPKTLSYSNELAPTKDVNTGDDTRSSIFNWISETNITYNKSIENHNIEVLANFSAQKEQSAYTYAFGKNFPNDNVTTINAAATTTGSSFEQESAMISFLGRVIYSYSDRYMLSASIRRDGSSKFAVDSRWGWFPSVSGGWNISREAFYPENASVNNLKIRASYGITGNAEIPYYGGTAVLGAYNYVFGNSENRNILLGFAPENSPNKNLSWESTSTANLGVDAGFFNNMFQLSIDAYQSETKDLLLNVTVPATSGFTSALQNTGKVRNRGLEVMLSTTQTFGKDWSWDGSLSMSTNKNTVMALGPGQEQILYSSGLSDPSFIVKVGESLGFFLWL